MGIHRDGRARAAAGWRRRARALAALALALALAIGAAAPALAMDAPQTRWSRLWGQGALDTMQRVVGCGDASEYGNAFADGRGGTVVVATMGGYWDALTASGLAGIEDAPLLMTDASSLSAQTASELERLSPDRVVICGGDMAVSEGVEGEISDLTGAEVVRLAGTDAQDTARRVHGASDRWSRTAFVATVASFQDALSVAPYAYAEHCPIFLTGWDGRLSGDTLSDIEAGGFDSVYVVGGPMVVSPDVEGQLGGLFAGRLWGADAADTSRSIAEWELGHGMSADGVGVATVSSYYDALCGAALCGRNGSVLVLVSGSNLTCVDGVVAANSDDIGSGYIFGGEMAVPASVADALARATADPFPDVDAGYQGSITYRDGVVVVPDAGWAASADGSSVTLPASAVPDGVAAGTTVALTGEGSAGEAGRLLRVTSVSSDGGSVTLTGTTPDASDAVESIDAEGVTSDVSSFVPADGVTVEGASSAGDALSPQDEGGGTSWGDGRGGSGGGSWGDDGQSEDHLGKLKVHVGLGGGGELELAVEPTVEYSIHGTGKDMSVYVGSRVETTASLVGKEKIDKDVRLGVLTCPTKVPGLSVSVTLWAVASAEGSVSVECSSVVATGVQYAGGRWRTPRRADLYFDGCKVSAELRVGVDLDVSADVLSQPVADAALGGGAKASAEESLRPSALVCDDLKAGPYFQVSMGEHSLMKKFGITCEVEFLDDCMPLHAHFEDGATVPECTWHDESVEGAEVGGLPASLGYTGGPVRPSGLTVVVSGRQLVEGTDYRLTYEDNVGPGTATVTIRGIGSYRGVARRTFEIEGPSDTVWGTLYSVADPGATDPSPSTAEYLAVTRDGRTLQTATIDGREKALTKVGDGVDMSDTSGWDPESCYALGRGDVTRAAVVDRVRPASCRCLFCGMSSLVGIDGMANLDTSRATDMTGLFAGCPHLVSIDLSTLDTSNVTDMVGMFAGCAGLKSLDLSHLDTSNVTRMSGDGWFGGMFYGCSGLTTLDLSPLKTSKVTDMTDMFDGCSGLTSLDLTPLDTSSVTSMFAMFEGCSGLTSLDLTPLKTSAVTNMGAMFWGCSGLTSLDLTSLDTSSVTDMHEMFERCSGLTSLDLASLKTSSVTDMDGMFAGCSGLASLDLSPLDTSAVTDMGDMFMNCSGLTSLDLSPLDTSNVTDMDSMFAGCSGLTSLDLSPLKTSAVTDMSRMFDGCSGLTSLDLSHMDTSKFTDMHEMFEGCAALSSITYGPKFVKADGLYTKDMFSNCPANKPSWWTES